MISEYANCISHSIRTSLSLSIKRQTPPSISESIVKQFSQKETIHKATKTSQHVLISNVTKYECKWMCELFEKCGSFDYSYDKKRQCYIHTVPSDKLERKGQSAMLMCYTAKRTHDSKHNRATTQNWAHKGKYVRGERSLYIICY